MFWTNHRIRISTLLALFLLVSPGRAADFNWTNTLGGDWNVPLNWSPNQVPGTNDNAYIMGPDSYLVNVSNNGIFNLTVGGSSGTQSLVMLSDLTIHGTATFATNTILENDYTQFWVASLRGPGWVAMRGQMIFHGGAVEPGLGIEAEGVLNLSGPYNTTLTTALTNAGKVVWTDGALIPSGPIANLASGTFDLPGSAELFAAVYNAGLMRKTTGDYSVEFAGELFNTGTIDVQAGTVEVSWGGRQDGRLRVAEGASIEFRASEDGSNLTTFGAGHTNEIFGSFVAGPHSLYAESNVAVILPNLTLYGGILLGAPGSSWTVNGPFYWRFGGMSGPFTFNANGVTTLSESSHEIQQVTFNNSGTVIWNGGPLVGGNGAVFNNQAGHLFDVQCDGLVSTGSYFHIGLPKMTFSNAGTFQKSAGTGTTLLDLDFHNHGTIEAQSGNLSFVNLDQESGATLLKGGSVNSPSGPLPIKRGMLGGSGSVSGSLSMSGQLSPGLSAGMLLIQGDYTQTDQGSCNIEIGGAIAGTNYDQVVVSSNAALAGTINVLAINGFTPAVGDRFEIMKFGSRSGNVLFKGLDIANGISLAPEFSSTNIVLVGVSTPPAPAPRLHQAWNGSDLWLWWSQGYGSFQLQSTTNLNAPVDWSPVVLSESNRSIFNPGSGAQFFRMASP